MINLQNTIHDQFVLSKLGKIKIYRAFFKL